MQSHALDGDGANPEVFKVFGKESRLISTQQHLPFRIPDTILYYGCASFWYYFNEDTKSLQRYPARALEKQTIFRRFTSKHFRGGGTTGLHGGFFDNEPEGSHNRAMEDDDDDYGVGAGPRAKRKKSDIVALFVNTKSENLDITYFTKDTLKEFLFVDRKDLHGFLQMWVEPRLNNSDLVQVTYSPGQTFALRRVNRAKIYDQSVSPQTRCPTFDGPIHQSEELFCLPHVTNIHKDLCHAFVQHFSLIDPRHAIDRLVAYFRQDVNEQYWMLFTTSARVVEKVDQELADLLVSKKKPDSSQGGIGGNNPTGDFSRGGTSAYPGVSDSFASLLASNHHHGGGGGNNNEGVQDALPPSKASLDESRKIWAKHMKTVPEATKANTSNIVNIPTRCANNSSSSFPVVPDQPPLCQRDIREQAVLQTVQDIGNHLLFDRFKKSRTLLKHRIPVALYMKDLNAEERHLMSFQKYELEKNKRDRKKGTSSSTTTANNNNNSNTDNSSSVGAKRIMAPNSHEQEGHTPVQVRQGFPDAQPDPFAYNPLNGIDTDLLDRIKYNKKGRGGASREGALGTAKGAAGVPRVDRYNAPNPNLKIRPVPARLLSGFYTNSADITALQQTLTGAETYSDSDDPLAEFYKSSEGEDSDQHYHLLSGGEGGSDDEEEESEFAAEKRRELVRSKLQRKAAKREEAAKKRAASSITNLSQRELYTVSKVATIQRLRSQRDSLDKETNDLSKQLNKLRREGRTIMSGGGDGRKKATPARLNHSAQARISSMDGNGVDAQDSDSMVLQQISIIRGNGMMDSSNPPPQTTTTNNAAHPVRRASLSTITTATTPQKKHLLALREDGGRHSPDGGGGILTPEGKASSPTAISKTSRLQSQQQGAAMIQRSYNIAAEALRVEAAVRCVQCSDLCYPIFEVLRLLKRLLTLRVHVGGPASGSINTVEEELNSLIESTNIPGGYPISIVEGQRSAAEEEERGGMNHPTPASQRQNAISRADRTSLSISNVDASLLWFMDQHLAPGFLLKDLGFTVVESRFVKVPASDLKIPQKYIDILAQKKKEEELVEYGGAAQSGFKARVQTDGDLQSHLAPTERASDRRALLILRARQFEAETAAKQHRGLPNEEDDDMARMIDEIKSGVVADSADTAAAKKNKEREEAAELSHEAKLLEEPDVMLQKRVVTLKISQPFPCLSSMSLAAASLQRLVTKHAHEAEDFGAHLASKLVPSSSSAAPVGRGQPVDSYTLHNQMMKEIITTQRLRALQSAAAVKPTPSNISSTSKARSTNANSTPTTTSPTSLQHPTTATTQQPLDETTVTPLQSDIEKEEDGIGMEQNDQQQQNEDSLIHHHHPTETSTLVVEPRPSGDNNDDDGGAPSSIVENTPTKKEGDSINTSLVAEAAGPPHSSTPVQSSAASPSENVKPVESTQQQDIENVNSAPTTQPSPPPSTLGEPPTTTNDLAYLDSPDKEEEETAPAAAGGGNNDDDVPAWL